MKKILVLFETSGGVSVPFRAAGFNVTTVDILPHKLHNENHIQRDIRELLQSNFDFTQFDLLIAFPPCTYFSKAGLHYLNTQPGRKEKQNHDLELVKELWQVPIKKKCFENPRGSALNKLWQKSNCRIDYAEYCDYFKKPTDLWLDNLPPLLPNFCNYHKYGSFITKMSYRSGFRSNTPIEVGIAMVEQWAFLL